MIYIVGAGPAGCYTAYLLAKEKRKVTVFEEHAEVGKPVQCTGLLTESINDITKLPKSTIINHITRAKIYNGRNYFETPLKETVLDRSKFDKDLASKAKAAGATILTNHKLTKIKQNKKEIKLVIKNNNQTKEIKLKKDDILIGADGPNSIVRQQINKKRKIQTITGVQVRAAVENKGNLFETYLDKSEGFFAWSVPEDKKTLRIGLASKHPSEHLKKLLIQLKIKDYQVIETQGGLIPIYNPKLRIQKNNIYIVGDAATQVKASTGGGIIPGLTAAKALAEAIINKKNYSKLANKKLKIPLIIHLKIRKILNKFSKSDLNQLIQLCNQSKIKNILENTNRDNPIKLLLLLAIKEPRFLLYIKYLF